MSLSKQQHIGQHQHLSFFVETLFSVSVECVLRENTTFWTILRWTCKKEVYTWIMHVDCTRPTQHNDKSLTIQWALLALIGFSSFHSILVCVKTGVQQWFRISGKTVENQDIYIINQRQKQDCVTRNWQKKWLVGQGLRVLYRPCRQHRWSL